MPYPDILEIIDTYMVLKGAKRKGQPKGRPSPDRVVMGADDLQFMSVQERQAYNAAMAKDAMEAKRGMKHISTQPSFVQQSFAMRNKSMAQVWDEMKGK